MKRTSFEDIQRAVMRIVQPLGFGDFDLFNGLKARLASVIPFGSGDLYTPTSPFGFISAPVKGVVAYFLNLHGQALAPIILGHLDKNRPMPSAPGEVIVYCTSADGTVVPVTLTLKNDGTLVIVANTKIQVQAPAIELGAATLEKVINGETFMQLFNSHVHTGNLGAPTSPPIAASQMVTATHLSAVVKASK